MNIKNIKQRADQLLVESKPQLCRIFLIILLIGLLRTLFSSFEGAIGSIISLVILYAFLTLDHGYIVSTLKVVRNNSQALKDDDAWVGFSRYKDLFFTYFLQGLVFAIILIPVMIVISLVIVIFFGGFIGNITIPLTSAAFSDASLYTQLYSILYYAPQFLILALFIVIVVFIVAEILMLYLFPVPYLLEQYHFKGGRAISESFSFMKGHVWDLFKLNFSFFGWILLSLIIQVVISQLLVFIPVLGDLIAVAASGLFMVYVYYPRWKLSQTIFFEEIAYYRYDQRVNQMANEQGATYEQ